MEETGGLHFTKLSLTNDFKKIVIAESIVFVARTLMNILKAEGYFVILAADGKTALHMINTYMPDLAIVSQRLPDMSGIDLVREIRCMEAHKNLRIIYTSSEDNKNLYKEAVAAGVDYYLLKPYEKKRLIGIIRELDLHEMPTEIGQENSSEQ